MLKITFSHDYPKLWNQTAAQLVKIDRVRKEDLHDDLIEYDTLTSDGAHYKLPDGDLIHLTFLGDKLIPFCTIRPYAPMKFKYYQSNIGKVFNVKAPYGVEENDLF